MNTGRRLPLLTEVLELPAGAGPEPQAQTQAQTEAQTEPQTEPPSQPQWASPATARVVGSLAALHAPGAVAAAPAAPLAEHPAVSTEMARAVLELELEQALREVLEPRLALLLRETAAELAQRLQPRMHEWLDEHGAAE